jgi:aryl-alcohol dehydrogenase-like predicted oxidoreductase
MLPAAALPATTVTRFQILCHQPRETGPSLQNQSDQEQHSKMDYVTLGRTGLRVSVAGLGCGGFSRLGLGTGRSEADAVRLVRQALDLGINLIDTAAVYGTENVVGQAIKTVPRDSVVIATKAWIPRREAAAADRAVACLDNSLRELGVDYIDIFQLHGVSPGTYDRAVDVIAPALLREREKGKIRYLGVTETGSSDAEHDMVQRAVADGIWDVVMVAFHMMHQNARTKVFPRTTANHIGTLLMFAVRNIFSRPERLTAALRDLTTNGQLPRWLADAPNPLGFLVHEAGARTIPEAAYRFVRHEPGVDVVLFGTGDRDHLRKNVASLLAPPLPLADRQTLVKLFGHLVGVGLDPPESMPGLP